MIEYKAALFLQRLRFGVGQPCTRQRNTISWLFPCTHLKVRTLKEVITFTSSVPQPPQQYEEADTKPLGELHFASINSKSRMIKRLCNTNNLTLTVELF